MSQKHEIEVVNLKCGGCEKGIKDALSKLGIKNIEVSVKEGTVSFEGDLEVAKKELARLGYPEKNSKEAQSFLKSVKSYTTCAIGTIKEGVKKKEKRGAKFWALILTPVLLALAVFFLLFRSVSAFWLDDFFKVFSFSNFELTQSSKNYEDIKQEALREFEGAYEKEIEKSGKVKFVKLVAAPSEVEIFDGYKTKVWAYNGRVPGPEIRIRLGDTLKINFKNKLPQDTTIHFHGVRVPNAMDGVPGVTQPPIKPGESFVYEFTPKDAGTFWFHPHVRSSEQIERGLFATLIVEDEYSDKYSQDKVFVLDDWRMTRDAQVFPYFDTRMDIMHDGRWGNVITTNGKLKEVLTARPGERLRLRFVNSSNARVYKLYFPKELKAKAIAVDGMYVRENFDPDGFDLAPGNRLDVDLIVPDSKQKEFVIFDNFTREINPLLTIKVKGGPVKTPDFDYPKNLKVPKWSKLYKLPNDKLYVLNIEMRRGGAGKEGRRQANQDGMGMMGGMGAMKLVWTINGKAYPDYDPFTFKADEVNIFEFRNDSFRIHPMHLHGQFFKVIARDGKPTDEGFFRDTVLVYPKESVKLAMVPMDKGRWANHCHILEHAEAGMMTIVEVK